MPHAVPSKSHVNRRVTVGDSEVGIGVGVLDDVGGSVICVGLTLGTDPSKHICQPAAVTLPSEYQYMLVDGDTCTPSGPAL